MVSNPNIRHMKGTSLILKLPNKTKVLADISARLRLHSYYPLQHSTHTMSFCPNRCVQRHRLLLSPKFRDQILPGPLLFPSIPDSQF